MYHKPQEINVDFKGFGQDSSIADSKLESKHHNILWEYYNDIYDQGLFPTRLDDFHLVHKEGMALFDRENHTSVTHIRQGLEFTKENSIKNPIVTVRSNMPLPKNIFM